MSQLRGMSDEVPRAWGTKHARHRGTAAEEVLPLAWGRHESRKRGVLRTPSLTSEPLLTTECVSEGDSITKNPPAFKDEEFSEEDVYEVEKILSKQTIYLVKWKGYSQDHNTWEPLDNLIGCPQLIQEFESAADDSVSDD
jgi:hypothetical protein